MNELLQHAFQRILDLERRVSMMESMFIMESTPSINRPAPVQTSAPDLPSTPGTNTPSFPTMPAEQEQADKQVTVEGDGTAALEKYPRIIEKLLLFWGHPECNQFLDKLVIDHRGNRQGFEREAMAEVMLLMSIQRLIAPPETKDIWEDHSKIGDRR